MSTKVGLRVVVVLWLGVIVVGIVIRRLVAGLAATHGESSAIWWLGLLSEALLIIPIAASAVLGVLIARARRDDKRASQSAS